MPRTYNGGWKRHRFNKVPYSFARNVKEVTGQSASVKKFLVESDTSRASFVFHSGMKDHCFVLPATELCGQGPGFPRTANEVLTRGAGIHFDVIASRQYSIRIIAFRHPSSKPWFAPASGSDDGLVAKQGATVFSALGDSAGLGTKLLLGPDPILVVKADSDPIHYPVNPNRKKRIYMDRTFYGRGSVDRPEVRPFDAWVDSKRKMKFADGSGCGMVMPSDFDETRYDFYFAVIVHVDSFLAEQAAVVERVFGGGLVRIEDDGDAEMSGSASKRPRQHVRSVSEMPTVVMPNNVPAMPAIELRSLSARFYWRQNSD